MGYTKDTIKGISWVGLFRFFTRIIALLRTVILARIFNPAQFGVFGVASLVLALVEILTDTGINVFLVQAKGDGKKYLNTAWFVSIIRGIIIGLIIFITSWLTVSFFNSQSALGLIMLISVVPVIRGFINPAIAFFQKELAFKKEFYFKSLVFLSDSIISIILALLTRNIYSLVIGMIVAAVFEVIFSFIYVSIKPKFTFDRKHFDIILHSGKWVTAAGVFNYIFSNLDSIVVGRLLGTYSLGLYQMAYKISVNPLTELSDILSRVTFPVYVKISSDKKRTKNAFIKSLVSIMFIAIPLAIIGFYFADIIVNLLLGSKWVSTVPVFRILIIFGAIRTILGYASSLFLGFNKQKYVTLVTFVGLIGLAIFIYPLTINFGIVGAAYSALIGALFTAPLFVLLVRKLL